MTDHNHIDQYISAQDIQEMEQGYRANLINCLSGPRAVFLIGTADKDGNSNLAIFNSIIHLGADPPLLGMLSRPDSVERHTLENIRDTGFYTINSIHREILAAAHQCSARYLRTDSEFIKTGLSAEYRPGFHAPYVAASKLRIGMKFLEEKRIEQNQTILIIGQIEYLYLPEGLIDADGNASIFNIEPVVSCGLSTYGLASEHAKLPYAKP
jgi:flavin reductase (DIM6/NTAB) family NADH-FMN oxidoreductase RutF